VLAEERMNLDRVVHETEGLRRAAFEAIPTMCFVVDEAGLLASVNAFGARRLGCSAGELVGQPWLNLFHEHDRSAVRAHAEHCFREVGSVMHWEARRLLLDGEIMHVRETGHTVLVNDRPVLFIASEDVTERKRIEEALRHSERYLVEAQRLAHTGSWTHNHVTGITTHYSDETFRLFGLDPRRGYVPQLDEILQLIHPEDRERVSAEHAQILRDKAEYAQDYRVVLHDGTVRHLQSIGHPIIGPGGELLEYFGTVMDVTERRRAEKRLLLQIRITRILSEAATVNEAMPRILQAVCESLGWHLSVLWQVDPQANVLRCADMWCVPSIAVTEFKAATGKSTFVAGSDLPGTVWAGGKPACIRDVSEDAEFSRAKVVANARLRGAFAFPILVGCEVLGVIESFTRDLWQSDGDLVAMMANIGSQIGQFTKRAAAVDELQLRVGMLQNIPVAAWSVMPDGTPDIVTRLWFEYTGQTPEYVHAHSEAWMTTIHPEDREKASRTYWDGVLSGRGFTMEARFLRAQDGMYRWHLNRAVAVRDSEGNILRLVGTSTDVHDLRVAQEDLRKTESRRLEQRMEDRLEERTRIARELHDSLLQGFQGLMFRLEAVRQLLPERSGEAAKSLDRALEAGDRAIGEGRDAIQNLRSAFDDRDLPDSLEALGAELSVGIAAAAKPEYRVVVEGRPRDLIPLVRDEAYRIVREAVRNAYQHANARHIEAEVTFGDAALTLRVRDDGVGVDPQVLKRGQRAGHWGFPGMRERSKSFGGQLSVWSERNAGTEVELLIAAQVAYAQHTR
jgi:PAS domain S-box-containing protein